MISPQNRGKSYVPDIDIRVLRELPMNIIIIDDEKLYLQTIQEKINDWSNRNTR